MTRTAFRSVAAVALAASVLAHGAAPARAKDRAPDAPVFRYPSEIDESQLRILLQSSDDPVTVIFEKGDHVFSPQLYVFDRANLTLCGATGRAGDVTILSGGGGVGSGATAAILVEQSRNVSFRDLTIRATAASSGQGVRLNAQLGTDFSSFVDGVTLRGCTVDAEFPLIATASARNLTVDRSTIVCRRQDGFGIVWGDGPGLLVTRTRFETSPGVQAVSAVFVQGAGATFSEGERARTVLLTRNKVTGDFLRGFDLADVREARVRGNRFVFPGAASRTFGGLETGRVGVLVRRGASSSLPVDYELTRNRVRNAWYGAWILNGGQGVLRRNDFRRCGSPRQDEFFQEFGGGVRLTLFSRNCQVALEKNDLRDLRSPRSALVNDTITDVPAVVVVPGELSGACFDDGDGGNKTSSGRALFAAPETAKR